MGTLLDHQAGLAIESTFGTPVTPSRFFEILGDDSSQDFDPMPLQGQGLRVGRRYDRSGRRVAGIGKGTVTLKVEIASKGFGLLWQLCMGTATSTLVSGATFQQVATPVITTPYLPSCTLQVGVVEDNAAGTVDPYTFAGCTVNTWTLELPEGGIPTLTVEFDCVSLATATALATASFPTTPTLFTFALGSVTAFGSLTAPTTTAIATGGTAATNVRSWSLAADNGLDQGRWRVGGRNQPTAGEPNLKLKAKIEYDQTTFRAAQLAQSVLSFSSTLTTVEALSVGNATFQLAIPAMEINSGAIPSPANGDTITTDLEFEVLDDLVAAAQAYIVHRTADAAL